MKKPFNYLILFIFTVALLISCSSDDDSVPPVNETPKSEAKQLTSFVFNATNNEALEENVTAVINEANKTITVTVPYGTDITVLQPTIEISEKATINPTGTQSFSSPADYTVTAEDNTEAVYEVTVSIALNDEKQIISFVFEEDNNGALREDVIAEVNEEEKTITVIVPYNTKISALVPTIEVSEAATISPEGAQEFFSPVNYTVTAEDGTEEVYEVTVEVESNDAKQMLSFQFLATENGALSEDVVAEIDEENKTITATVPNGTDITALISSIEISAGATTITPEGGRNFTNPVSYTVIAHNGTEVVYEVTVEVESSEAKQMLSFQFLASENGALNENIEVEIDEENKTITATVPNGTDVTALIPSIEISAGAIISPEGAQDFSNPVSYTVIAQNDSEAVYEVTVEVESSDAKQMLSFQFLASENEALNENIVAEIDEENKIIIATVPYGTDTTLLLPNIEISGGATITPEGEQDYTNQVSYTITAQDETEVNYEVIVTIDVTSEREALIAIYNANPDNYLDWDVNNPDSDISTWEGVITDENGKVIELGLTDKNLIKIPSEIGDLSNLIKLYLGNNGIPEIPEEIGDLTNLTQFQIWSNDLESLPEAFKNLTKLTNLGLNGNRLSEFPEVSSLINLRSLTLSYNSFESIPDQIGNLENLEQLHVGSSNLIEISKEIGSLTNLKELHVRDSNLTEIPEEIGSLLNLTSLVLEGNALENLPKEIGNLLSLTSLNLGSNDLEDLPEEIGDLESLTSLTLSYNSFEVFPEQILNLINLRFLYLSGNKLGSIPTGIGSLDNLENLFLFNNKLASIPQEISSISSLERLYIQENELTSIPQAVCDLEETGVVIIKDEGVTCE